MPDQERKPVRTQGSRSHESGLERLRNWPYAPDWPLSPVSTSSSSISSDRKQIENPFLGAKEREHLIETHRPYYATGNGYFHHCFFTICVTALVYPAYSNYRHFVRVTTQSPAGRESFDEQSENLLFAGGKSSFTNFVLAALFVVGFMLVSQGLWVLCMGLPYTYQTRTTLARQKRNKD
jgi:hypothetical protein